MKINKKLLIAAGMITVLGAAVAGGAVALIISSSAGGAAHDSKVIDEKVSNIVVNARMSDVRFVSGNNDKIYVSYPAEGVNAGKAEVKGDTLTISYEQSKERWYDYIGLDFGQDNKIFIEVPKGMIADARIETEYGDIEAEGVGGKLYADAKNGDIEISHCDFDNLECITGLGDIELENTDAQIVDCRTGDGDIEFERLGGGIIELSADLGDIEGLVSGMETDYTINADTELGDNNLINRTGGEKTLNVKVRMGDIVVRFTP